MVYHPFHCEWGIECDNGSEWKEHKRQRKNTTKKKWKRKERKRKENWIDVKRKDRLFLHFEPNSLFISLFFVFILFLHYGDEPCTPDPYFMPERNFLHKMMVNSSSANKIFIINSTFFVSTIYLFSVFVLCVCCFFFSLLFVLSDTSFSLLSSNPEHISST